MRKSNYDKNPATSIEGDLWKGWDDIVSQLKNRCTSLNKKGQHIVVVEYYHGVHPEEIATHLNKLQTSLSIDTSNLFKAPAFIGKMTEPYMTKDSLFGYRSHFTYTDYLDMDKVTACKQLINDTPGIILIYGHAAAEVYQQADTLVYVDMARWEIQQRFRRKEINGLGVENKNDATSIHYKRGYFIDWVVCDNLKKRLLTQVDYWLDTHQVNLPKMITGKTMLDGLEKTAGKPFRVVPFFDPAPWGGQWMKEVCDLNREKENYGWCFDCVPEENSLYLNIAGELFEMPANNVIFHKSRELLGSPVEARFGADFPIRFDFLDTMGGGNLSLQVHPTNPYIRDNFGMYYTQDESYYLLDAGEDAVVYLGLKDNVNPDEMIAALNHSQETGESFERLCSLRYAKEQLYSTAVYSAGSHRVHFVFLSSDVLKLYRFFGL